MFRVSYMSDLIGLADEIGVRPHPKVLRPRPKVLPGTPSAPRRALPPTLRDLVPEERVPGLLASMPAGETFTTGQVGAWLGVDRRTVAAWTDARLIPVQVITLGGWRRYDRDALRAWITGESAS